jgi:hypothetical protein
MLLNQLFGSSIETLRAMLIDGEIRQSPSGISATIFTFGYQLASIVTFTVVYACIKLKNTAVILAISIFCVLAIYLGLQRSVLFAFLVSVCLFFLVYYKKKSALVITFAAISSFLLYNYALNSIDIGSDNILAKNERAGGAESRTGLVAENINVIMDYPYGLIFYGKNWGEAVKGNSAFPNGLTSHNAYLMFITYLGPFLGFGFLIALYYRVSTIFLKVILNGRIRENGLLVSLCFAFLSVSLNALFHNGWLLNTNGPTVFLYFAILHCYKITLTTSSVIEKSKN